MVGGRDETEKDRPRKGEGGRGRRDTHRDRNKSIFGKKEEV
jgi:hypothetical protein